MKGIAISITLLLLALPTWVSFSYISKLPLGWKHHRNVFPLHKWGWKKIKTQWKHNFIVHLHNKIVFPLCFWYFYPIYVIETHFCCMLETFQNGIVFLLFHFFCFFTKQKCNSVSWKFPHPSLSPTPKERLGWNKIKDT